MRKTIYPLWKRIFLLLTAITFLSVSSSAATREILILFDMSRSMRNYNTKQLSMLWMSAVVRSYKAPHRITLVGFDYELHEYFSGIISGETELELSAFSAILDKIDLNGKATDLEIPLRYALNMGAGDSLKMVLLITDGEPDIWAKNTGFLSPRVLTDARYEDLNYLYRSLKASGLSKAKLYNRLSTKYRERNLELIEQALSLLHGDIGKKLVIWDISGVSELLKRWARLSDAGYVPLETSTSESLTGNLHELLKELLDNTRTILKEQVPETDVLKDQAKETVLPGRSRNFIIVLVVFAVAIFIAGLLLYRKHRYSSRPVFENNESAVGKVSSQGLATLVTAVEEEPAEGHGEESDSDSMVDSNLMDTQSDKDEILEYIDRRLKSALGITEEFISELFNKSTAGLGADKRLSLRVQTPPGSIIVHWIERNGDRRSANAVNISMHGILLEASHCEADAIDRIEAPNLGMSIGVTRSIIKRRDDNNLVIILLEFERGVEDKMAWIEIQTRITGDN